MKIAIACSLQGPPEEPIAHAVGKKLANKLRAACPGHNVELYERADYPGAGDCYKTLARDIEYWLSGGGFAVHIHADASQNKQAYGYSILYGKESDLKLAQYLQSHLSKLARSGYTRDRGLYKRTDVAVLRRRNVAVLVEVGFYTNPQERARLESEDYSELLASLLADGIIAYARSISPEEKGEQEKMKLVVPLSQGVDGKPMRDPLGWYVYNCPSVNSEWWLDISNEHGADVQIKIWVNAFEKKDVVATAEWQGIVPPTTALRPGIHNRLRKIMPELTTGWYELSIHASLPLSVMVGD